MKVAELFAELGFKITGDQKLDDVDRGMGRAEVNAKKLAIRLGAVSAAMVAMIATSMRAGTALRNFVLTTGLSADELQVWQQRAAANGIAVSTLTEAVKALQTAQTNFALGEPESMGVWAMLGVDPRQDPFKVIESLRRRAGSFKDTGVFRNLLGRVGLEGLLPLIRSSNSEFEKWSRTFIITKQETEQLTKLNAQWQILKMSIASTKTQFSAILAPAITLVFKALTWVAEKASAFVHWLESAAPAAQVFRTALQVLIPLVIALSAAFAAAFALGPLLAFIVPLTQALAIAGALFLALDDIITSLRGGKSATREWGEEIGKWLAQFEWVRKLVMDIDEAIGKLRGAFDPNSEQAKKWRALGNSSSSALPPASAFSSGLSSSQNNTVNFTIEESKDPKATAREVSRIWSEHYSTALRQAPVAGH